MNRRGRKRACPQTNLSETEIVEAWEELRAIRPDVLAAVSPDRPASLRAAATVLNSVTAGDASPGFKLIASIHAGGLARLATQVAALRKRLADLLEQLAPR